MKKVLFFLTIFALTTSAEAQQVATYGQYFLNPYLYNPALAGVSERTRIFSLFRNQWVGIPGAPETQALTIDGHVTNRKIGLGLTVYNDLNNIITRSGGLGTYAYHLPLAKDHTLSMGISAGFARTTIAFDQLRADNAFDQTLLEYADHGTGIDGNIGAAYGFKNLRISASALQLFQNRIKFTSEERDKSIGYKLMRHYVISAQYGFMMNNNKLRLEPIALLKSAQGLPAQIDLNLVTTYKQNYWIALGHKLNSSVGLALGVFLHDRITVGYSYEYTTNKYADYNNGSHEVIVGFTFAKAAGKTVSQTSPDYSDLARQNKAQYETIDQVTQEKDMMEGDLEKQKQVIESQNEEIARLQQEIQKNKKEIDSIVHISKIDVHTETFDSTEHDTKYYTIVGAVKTLKFAKEFQQAIRRELSMETSIVQKSNGSYYFIYTKQIQDREEALAELKRLRQIKSSLIVGDPWVYKLIK
jgi:type IX secretion system PorP/SprF family membrane protein